jgi:uncharacterized protein (TIRG00374 family)
VRKPSPRVRRLLGAGLGVAVAAVTFVYVLPKVANYGAVWHSLQNLSWWGIPALLGAEVVNLVTYAPPWMAVLPGITFRQSFVVTQASTASTYIAPGGAAPGIAVSFAMLRGWGFQGRSVTLAVTLISVWNQLVILGFPTLALGLLGLEHESSPALASVAVIGAVAFVAIVGLFALAFSSESLARRIGDVASRVVSRVFCLIRHRPVSWTGANLARFRNDALGLLGRRWHFLTGATLAGHLTVFLVMLVSLRVFGVSSDEVSFVEAFAAWSLGRVLGSLPITPGGIGVVELGLTGILVGFGGHNAEVVAAVLVYRFLTIVPTILLGLAAAALWRRVHPSALERPTPAAAPGALPPP